MKPLTLAAVLLTCATIARAQEQTTSAPPPAPAEVSAIPADVPPPAPMESLEPAVFADEATPEIVPAPPPAPADSPLVKAAKANGNRKKSSRKVITNADVKKSKAKLIVVGSKNPGPATAVAKGAVQQQDDRLRARDAADAKIAAAEKRVAELEKEMHRVEQSFYDENDVTYRDDVIRKRFEQAKRQVDEARKALADARDEREKLATP
ncbi:MAG TPA: hypothetical protein VN605_09820 [Thermoanaerobaculia bacterium]|nr:hypothetical protein [Thermoanaerobaculia bacterium]